MSRLLIGSAMALVVSAAAAAAGPFVGQAGPAGVSAAAEAQIWLVQGNGKGNGKGKGNDQGRGHGAGKPKKGEQASGLGRGSGRGQAEGNRGGGPVEAARGRPQARADRGGENQRGTGNRPARGFGPAARAEAAERVLGVPAPEGRDMLALLAASALGLAGPQLVVAQTPANELIGYRNCPPGLARKDPPCVPPGLARSGIGSREWLSYDRSDYDEIWLRRRAAFLRETKDVLPDPDLLLLQSEQIETLFGLDPAPEGTRYALIDGLPVLLDEEDYRSLLVVNELAGRPDLHERAPIAPTAALTQSELIDLYRLPQPGAGQNYAVVNGQVVQLDDSDYEVLQLIRVARAAF